MAHLISSVGADTNRVIKRDLSTGAETVLAQREDSDVDVFDALAKAEDGDFSIISRDLADKIWLVASS